MMLGDIRVGIHAISHYKQALCPAHPSNDGQPNIQLKQASQQHLLHKTPPIDLFP